MTNDAVNSTWLLLILVVVTLISAVAVINSKHESRKEFVVLQKLLGDKDDMDVYWGRLQLELGAWTAHGRIEVLAETKLNMQQPEQAKIIVVQP